MYDIKKTCTASSVSEALQLLHENAGAVLVNGGTDVMIRMKERKLKEAVLISIAPVRELCGISLRENGDIAIGAGTTFDEIHRNPIIREKTPALAYAANQVGSPQIRHVATIGGNICNGAVSADSVPTLLCYDALLEVADDSGVHTVPLRGFHTGPGKVALDRSRELLTAVIIPKSEYDGRFAAYLKFGQRNAMEIATLGCAVSLRLSADKRSVDDLRIAVSVAAPTPLRCGATEECLKGAPLTKQTISALRKGVLSEVKPRDSWRASRQLRLQLSKELSERAFRQAVEAAGGKVLL